MTSPARFLEILNRQFQTRVASNPKYSLRAYARDLGVSPALLSGLLKGRKGLSEKSARLMCQQLRLSNLQTQDFMLSVAMTYGRSPKKRVEAQLEHAHLMSQKNIRKVLEGEALSVTANWIHLAVLELCELPACQHEVKWFSKMLKISEIATERAIKTLIDSKQLTLQKGRYVPAFNETTTEMDLPNPVIKNFHAEIMDRAKQSLFHDQPEGREFQGVTLAFHASDVEEAKEMIRSFHEEFCNRFYRSSRKKRNSVYQLCTQFFPLTNSK